MDLVIITVCKWMYRALGPRQGRNAYTYRGPMFWNKIEHDIKQVTSKNSFKTAFTKFLLCDVNQPG